MLSAFYSAFDAFKITANDSKSSTKAYRIGNTCLNLLTAIRNCTYISEKQVYSVTRKCSL